MTQKFRIRRNGNISGACPLDMKLTHINKCRGCDNLQSMSTLMGKPIGKIICNAGGTEGFTMKKRKRGEVQDADNALPLEDNE